MPGAEQLALSLVMLLHSFQTFLGFSLLVQVLAEECWADAYKLRFQAEPAYKTEALQIPRDWLLGKLHNYYSLVIHVNFEEELASGISVWINKWILYCLRLDLFLGYQFGG